MLKNKGIRALVIMGAVLALIITGCAPAASASVSENGDETIRVTGFGRARGNPDMANISIGVSVANEDVVAAVEQSNRVMERITQVMTERGIAEADIQTTNFNIWAEEQWDPQTGQRKDARLYRVDSNIQLTVRDVDDLSGVLQDAITNGANNIYGLNFGIQEPNALAQEARVAALRDARERAEQLAEELGVSLGDVVSVGEVSGGSVMPFFESAMGVGGGGGEPPISEGSMSVNSSIEVVYKIVR